MKYNLIETIMGTLVIIVAIAFLIFGINTNKINTSERVVISAVFDDISGLKIGDNIKISGINVGKIEDLKLINESFEAKVIMSIDEAIQLPEDSSARITSSSLLGGSRRQPRLPLWICWAHWRNMSVHSRKEWAGGPTRVPTGYKTALPSARAVW